VATVVVGGAVGHFTRRGVVFSALRALVIMGVASFVTYGVGHLVGFH
jgi:VIT1/CCC1 family predicted Fe2+/Mn2+ transporter